MDKMLTIYGIKNCNTMKKAMVWLDQHNVAYDFHDYKKLNISEETLREWAGQVDWTVLLNKAGTTFRRLPQEDKEELTQEKAISLMEQHPSLIKRPVVAQGGKILSIGFKEEEYKKLF
ncbi:arsenate reductase [Swingsia samuiensis]|uniref:Arsenate reductase n=1 Tax=Swingsia samuiensis TaxID=1293412 RepID=A0A4Y6UHM2_9PROT|nr:arsenate reductase [Swingsia samuiensis]QDH16534.1 arsenate reductase [Swingsia samuiensis]